MAPPQNFSVVAAALDSLGLNQALTDPSVNATGACAAGG